MPIIAFVTATLEIRVSTSGLLIRTQPAP